ncbi:PREDICTED: syntaxin-8 [Dufourea novaeangliae]|uniref:Syntaxin-8 n=1 Tax=Dufourea novaeangliae TaxID=178035 RepID=A0A154PSF3_DUFNO|nr:PREDICTED: syntaxin-8 [Dufourea novaeangliae]KZC14839.1 Syntaxin-8 [Dufourea novaeangliae]
MALVYIEDTDPWLVEYDNCEKLFREIMEQLTARNKHPKTSQAYASLSANIRICLKQYNREVQQLMNKVDEASRSGTITFEEAERRIRQIEVLQSRDVQLQKLYDARTNNLVSSRASLLTSGASVFVDGGTTSWAADDDDEKLIDIQIQPVADLRTQQERILQEQDKGLEVLCKVITRQKEIGQTISNEVNRHNEIIDNLANHMDRTDESVVNKTRQVRNISFKDRTCGHWIVIILLFVCIVTVALV